jgi:hypothetical protein
MTTLEKIFPSLSKFSDLDWEAVSNEYGKVSSKISFPEYLQIKAEDGDCPEYLYELAYYELAVHEAKNPDIQFPQTSGIHLNPTALFLSLEFDIERMLKEAELGKIEVYERHNVLCVFRDSKQKFQCVELDEDALDILEHLEDGPQKDLSFMGDKDHKELLSLVNLNIVFNITN